MVFRLLLDLETLVFLQNLKPAQRRRLFALLERIQEAPHRFSDFIDPTKLVGAWMFVFLRVSLCITGSIPPIDTLRF